MPAESKVVTTFLCHCRGSIAMDDADVEEPFEGEYRDRTHENGIEAPLGFITPKGGIDPSVVNFRSPLCVLLNGQFFPLTAEIQELQNVVEGRCARRALAQGHDSRCAGGARQIP